MAGRTQWERFTATLLAAATLFAAVFLVTAFLLDPYDTGRSPLKLKEGVRPQGPRTALASRGRDPQFTGAIFGNSHVQLLSPEHLKAKTDIPLVSLAAPATRPKEIILTIDWFLRHHQATPPQAIVVGVDAFWCTPDPALPNDKSFPFWLLSRSLTAYLAKLMRYDLVEEIPRRIAYLTSSTAERGRPDGYWDYEASYRAQGYATRPDLREKLETPAETGGGNASGPFPAAAALEAMMKSAPPETKLILVRPPVYVSALPKPGTPDGAAEAACLKAFSDFAARRPLTTLLNWRIDRPELHDSNLFFDHTHYRQPIARLIEDDIAAAIRAMD
ncbi:hypothetical protein [Bosea sp. TAB14]|uniref:hypothetical protein n=1 Tax=Bosea sp. TAB14 TaxID=3237481 RepID=UPI003F92CDCF